METPGQGPLDQHRKLEVFTGNWVGEEKIYPSPWDGGPASGRMESRMALDGFFLITDYTEERGGTVSYRGHGVYGWDPQDQCYTMHWFDSMGGIAKIWAKGRWEGDVLTYQHQHERGHSRYVYTLQGSGQYHFKIESSQDGKAWMTFMEGTYRKKS
jgi:hypothetical protein